MLFWCAPSQGHRERLWFGAPLFFAPSAAAGTAGNFFIGGTYYANILQLFSFPKTENSELTAMRYGIVPS